MKETKTQQIEKMYDFIFVTTKTQNKLLPIQILYGDGSRWNNDFKAFYAVYHAIKQIVQDNNLIPVID